MSLIIFPVNSEKRPTVKGWQSYTGDVNTPMRGIKVPDGVVIIDADLYKGVSTDDIDGVLLCQPDWNAALLQTTLKGGKHFAFRCDNPNIIQGSDVLGLIGFDTRVAGKGYIATGKGYNDETLFGVEDTLLNKDLLPELPREAIEALSNSRGERVTFDVIDDDDGLMNAVNAAALDLSDNEVQAYLDALQDNYVTNRDNWLVVCAALNRQYNGSEKGYRILDEFSQRVEANYDENANRRSWESFNHKPADSITFASVIKAAGGRLAVSHVAVKSLEEKIKETLTVNELRAVMAEVANTHVDKIGAELLFKSIQQQYEVVTSQKVTLPTIRMQVRSLKVEKHKGDFVSDYVYITGEAVYMERDSKARMIGQAFNVKHNRHTPADVEGAPQTASRYADFNIEVVNDVMYHPQALIYNGDPIFYREGQKYFNTYTPTRLERVPVGTTDVVPTVKRHIAHLIGSEVEQDLVINYLAHNVQFPGKKIPWAISLQGIPGDGKSAFAVMMRYLLGDANIRILDPRELLTNFTGWAAGQTMTFVEEVKISGGSKYDTMNGFKPFVSNETVAMTRKGEDPVTVINTTNYFMLTNYKDAIPIDDGDRRYAVLFSQWQSPARLAEFQRENPDYYTKLYDSIRANPGELLDWLMTHEIPESFFATQRAPITTARNEAIELSKSESHEQVEDALEEFAEQITNENGEIDITILQDLVNASIEFDGKKSQYFDFPTRRNLARVLNDMDFHRTGRRKVGGGDSRPHLFYAKN